MKNTLFTFILFSGTVALNAQVAADTTYQSGLPKTFPDDNGPCVCIDAAHTNLHTIESNFKPFALLLREHGYQVKGINTIFSSKASFGDCRVLVISNALHSSNQGSWQLPTPSAFTKEEISTLEQWVKDGDSLWLIADHMPFAGAAKELAARFGFDYSNGFAQMVKGTNGNDHFSKEQGTLEEHETTAEVPYVVSFTGSAFRYPEKAEPLMVFTAEDVSREPEVAWQFDENTKRVDLKDYAQAALMKYGKGRLAVFGEAAMLTAQIANGQFKAGFNSPQAPHNARFLLNVLQWLNEGTEPVKNLQVHPIEARLQEMVSIFKSGKYEDLTLIYSDSAMIVGDQTEVSGRDEIRAYWKNLEGRGVDWELESISIQKTGTAYLQRGISRLSFKHEGSVVRSDSRFSLVWIWEGGAWRILLDHYSPALK
ncbi:MAG: nuclear transport factor 2 family protein [Owenweeksia sp.]